LDPITEKEPSESFESSRELPKEEILTEGTETDCETSGCTWRPDASVWDCEQADESIVASSSSEESSRRTLEETVAGEFFKCDESRIVSVVLGTAEA